MSIQTSLDSLKRLALKNVLDNLSTAEIKSEHIMTNLLSYVKYGSQSLFSLSTLVAPDIRNIYASDFSAKILMAYLELYTHYIIAAANTETVSKLSTISLSKYAYILFKYKEASSLIEEKKALKEYKYVRHINFSAPKYILSGTATGNIFNLSNTLQLSYKNMLSLPIMNNKEVYPDDTVVYINDKTIANLKYTSNNKNISASILRKYGSHIGSIKEVKCLTSTAISGSAQFNGIVSGFMATNIYFMVDSVIVENNKIASLIYKTSINGQDWTFQSGALAIDVGVEYDIYILNSIRSGTTFKIPNTTDIANGTIWALVLDYDHLSYPVCDMKLIFNLLNPISYITYNDISEFDLDISGNSFIKREETGLSESASVYQNSIENIVPVNGNVYSVDISSSQSRHKLTSGPNGELLLKYDYDIADITGNSNVYYKAGSIIFDKLAVENISTVCLTVNDHKMPLVSGEEISRTNILYTLVTETKYGISEIPILPGDYYKNNPGLIVGTKYFSLEPVIFNDKVVKSMDVMRYTLKHNFLNDIGTYLYKFNNYGRYTINDSKFDIISIAASGNMINAYKDIAINTTGDIGAHYVYKSNIFMGNMLTINSVSISGAHNWTITNNKTAYMFYIDSDGLLKIALKLVSSLDTDATALTQFSGNIYGKVTMLSSDESYISPYVVSYTLSCI